MGCASETGSMTTGGAGGVRAPLSRERGPRRLRARLAADNLILKLKQRNGELVARVALLEALQRAASPSCSGPVEEAAQVAAQQVRAHAQICVAADRPFHSAAHAARVACPEQADWHRSANRTRHDVGKAVLLDPPVCPESMIVAGSSVEPTVGSAFAVGTVSSGSVAAGYVDDEIGRNTWEVVSAWHPLASELAITFLQDVECAADIWYLANCAAILQSRPLEWPWSAVDAVPFYHSGRLGEWLGLGVDADGISQACDAAGGGPPPDKGVEAEIENIDTVGNALSAESIGYDGHHPEAAGGDEVVAVVKRWRRFWAAEAQPVSARGSDSAQSRHCEEYPQSRMVLLRSASTLRLTLSQGRPVQMDGVTPVP